MNKLASLVQVGARKVLISTVLWSGMVICLLLLEQMSCNEPNSLTLENVPFFR